MSHVFVRNLMKHYFYSWISDENRKPCEHDWSVGLVGVGELRRIHCLVMVVVVIMEIIIMKRCLPGAARCRWRWCWSRCRSTRSWRYYFQVHNLRRHQTFKQMMKSFYSHLLPGVWGKPGMLPSLGSARLAWNPASASSSATSCGKKLSSSQNSFYEQKIKWFTLSEW